MPAQTAPYTYNSFGDLVPTKKEQRAEGEQRDPVRLPRPGRFDPAPPEKPPKGWEKLAAELGVVAREDPQTKRIAFERTLGAAGGLDFTLAEVEGYLASKGEAQWLGLRQGKPESAKGVYTSLVPMGVLEMVSEILGAYPQTEFYVSEPVPFLKVVLDGCLAYVVAHWPVPGFGR
jgi:hypothetical protein